ncbi:hypothetical protein D3C78_1299960 [compost metagenome]
MIERYIDERDPTNPFGKAKEATLRAVAASCLGGRLERGLTSRALVDYALWRMSPEGGGVKPQTINNELSHLGSLLSLVSRLGVMR